MQSFGMENEVDIAIHVCCLPVNRVAANDRRDGE